MSERRKPGETVCIHLLAAKIIAGEEVFDFGIDKRTLKPGVLEEVACLGEGCQMFQLNDKKCGLRSR